MFHLWFCDVFLSVEQTFYKTESRSADFEETPTMSSQDSHCITGSALANSVHVSRGDVIKHKLNSY